MCRSAFGATRAALSKPLDFWRFLTVSKRARGCDPCCGEPRRRMLCSTAH
jgi:hypothetical protein